MLDLLRNIRAMDYKVEAFVEEQQGFTYFGVVKHLFKIDKNWELLGRAKIHFEPKSLEITWIVYELPPDKIELFEHRTMDAIKEQVVLQWGTGFGRAFDKALEGTKITINGAPQKPGSTQ